MLKIGLTGGIGSGKTTVTDLFARHGVPIIDADMIAHQLTQARQPALAKIQAQFGAQAINSDGSLNRAYLKQIIFTNPLYKKQLEAILHPLIFAEISNQIAELHADYVILCIPLLLETGRSQFVDRILVIDCPIEMQIERVKTRDQLSDATIQAIIDTQTSRSEKLYAADDIINNSGTEILLADQVKKLHNSYSLLSQATKGTIH